MDEKKKVFEDKAAAIEFAKEQLQVYGKDSKMYSFLLLAIDSLSDEPKGTWEHIYDESELPFMQHRWKCPVCERKTSYGQPEHCPNCGARLNRVEMRGEES